jgi:hypothetical protein
MSVNELGVVVLAALALFALTIIRCRRQDRQHERTLWSGQAITNRAVLDAIKSHGEAANSLGRGLENHNRIAAEQQRLNEAQATFNMNCCTASLEGIRPNGGEPSPAGPAPLESRGYRQRRSRRVSGRPLDQFEERLKRVEEIADIYMRERMPRN